MDEAEPDVVSVIISAVNDSIKSGRLDSALRGRYGAAVHAEKAFDFYAKVEKVDETLGVVFGWAIVCKEKGQDYFDTQDDHIPEASMLKAATDFMCHSRVLGDMHVTAEGGSVVFAFPMTADIAEAFGMKTEKTGLMIGVKPASADTLAKFKSGEYSGFSIGGIRVVDEEVD